MTISVAVMAHKRRAEFVPELLDRLELGEDAVVWDQHDDRWDTGRRAMLHHDPVATHHLVIQDDAVVPRDLIPGVERALDLIPADDGTPTPMSLYLGSTRPYKEMVSRLVGWADASAAGWLAIGLHWGVGIVMPTDLIEPMIEWGDTAGADIANYDKRIGRWLAKHGIRCWHPWPSLVDHRDSPSLVPGRGWRGRHAYRFIGEQASALDIDLSGPVITDGGPRSPNMTKADIIERLEALGQQPDKRKTKAQLQAELDAAQPPAPTPTATARPRRRQRPTPALTGDANWSERVQAKQAERRRRAGLVEDGA